MSATTPTMGLLGLTSGPPRPGRCGRRGDRGRPNTLDEGLVDDGGAGTDFACGTGVALVEIAAGEDANAEGGEETRADGVEVDAAIAHGAAIGLDGHFVAPGA